MATFFLVDLLHSNAEDDLLYLKQAFDGGRR